MIKKYFELEKTNFKKNNLFLFYGLNNGLKNEIIEKNFVKNNNLKLINYDENSILNNTKNFLNELTNKSFFDEGKIYKIDRATDKILNFLEKIKDLDLEDSILIINSGQLEKKSKLRNFFEKNKSYICVPFYPDDNRKLFTLALNFFKEKNISISPESINLLVDRSREDRENLKLELDKIEMYCLDKKNISLDEVMILSNLSENYQVFELVDNCLAKNTKKTINILNENNYSSEDCILIIRSLLIKAKRLLKLKEINHKIQNLDDVILSYKPTIFWKEKDIVKKQIQNWNVKDVHKLIYKINEIEILIKKNFSNSLNILSDFIIFESKSNNSI